MSKILWFDCLFEILLNVNFDVKIIFNLYKDFRVIFCHFLKMLIKITSEVRLGTDLQIN